MRPAEEIAREIVEASRGAASGTLKAHCLRTRIADAITAARNEALEAAADAADERWRRVQEIAGASANRGRMNELCGRAAEAEVIAAAIRAMKTGDVG